jgi:ribosomal protein S18 acetylase RimI-like enzyme
MTIFRKLEIKDESDLIELFKQLTKGPIDFSAAEALNDKNFHGVVVCDGGRIIGFGALMVAINPPNGKLGMLGGIVVDKDYQGQGTGKNITVALVDLAKSLELRFVQLTSNPDNPVRKQARKLYEKLGFVEYQGLMRKYLV